MAKTHFQGNETATSGELPQVGDNLAEFNLVNTELGEVSSKDFQGRKLVLNIFPSVDTGVCATSVRKFNEAAASLENTTVLCISKDLPFALGRFCSAEGIENVTPVSAFRSTFGEDNGIVLEGSPLKGLLARSVIVVDENGKVAYTQLVDEISTEPDYDAALAALN
ncbi:thiol peroxidase [Corynebacterium glutamicum MB001]|uniref:Thiol peroxidase n=4 Tax=Corynebacterium TaxID=1716 RepID=TPX_CORGL|nr:MULTISPECIES: thiol peroxidase [Corynebacterium]Q8NRG3.1 RecName: Full=Thiol peroxidase; Short=Tpx; AltName: Full=Peroxiredoxin tpx; Short=Prx; AltName: Full=Thioredoxin peroxidase; AltName: Full=Thioredoxin-dependent peroxiredoxin [Corynebacterium glutamicum ATCC 13032]AGN18833.1 lipid hydroperoxide peroxidase [Corynebacterium glutamicum SCgG1]AGN21856.1 lipid hydroperoxide peroxidase [Corynebacterium glutamicum SCgG2]AGT05079.1 thiol peroxidase [Corynebacterium glutamicum MB001]AIK87560.1